MADARTRLTRMPQTGSEVHELRSERFGKTPVVLNFLDGKGSKTDSGSTTGDAVDAISGPVGIPVIASDQHHR